MAADGFSYFPVRNWQLAWYVCISFVGVLGNGAVIFVTFASKKIQQKAPFNVYLLSLAIIDLLISIFAVPIYLLSTDLFEHPTGIAGEWTCKLVTGYFFPFWMLDISAFLLVALVLERRRAIIEPFSILKEHSLAKPLLVVLGILMLSIVTQAPTIYGSHFIVEDATIGNHCIYRYDNLLMKIMHYNSFTLECIIPTGIFIICFWQINRQLMKLSHTLHASLLAYTNNVYEVKLRNVLVQRKTSIDTLKLVVIMFIVCVVINEVFFMITEPVLKATSLQWNSNIYQFTVMLRFSNSCINPLLYGFKSKTFRKRLQDIFLHSSIPHDGTRKAGKKSKSTISKNPFSEII